MSSREAENALKRLGFEPQKRTGKGGGSSHRAFARTDDSGRKHVTVIPLKKNPIKRWTLKKALELGEISVEEFVKALK